VVREAVRAAAEREDVRQAVAHIYAQLLAEIDLRRPRCEMSGRCCRFDEYGHRLYVTTMELAAFAPSAREGRGQSEGCPFQIDGLCSVHAIRPFGCRVFFCDSASDDWQHAQYERFHAQLKSLHERLGVPYRYVEWRQALRELGLACETASGKPSGRPSKVLSLPQLRL
jgi:Fe-S-cluster containining protein